MADDARIVFAVHHGQIGNGDAKAGQEAGVALHVNRDVVLVDVQHGDLGVGRLGSHGGRSPFADQHAGFKVVGGKGHVLRFGIGNRGVQRDHEDTRGAGVFQRRSDRVVRGSDQDALGPSSHAVFDGGDLRSSVAVLFTGIGLEVEASGSGGLLGAFLHLHEEGVGVVLGDQAGQIGRRGGARHQRQSGSAHQRGGLEFHAVSSQGMKGIIPF